MPIGGKSSQESEVSKMKYYTLEAVVNDNYISFNKTFKSRDEAIKYMFKYLEKHFVYNFNVNEVYALRNKHEVKYVCDYNNCFQINRVSL